MSSEISSGRIAEIRVAALEVLDLVRRPELLLQLLAAKGVAAPGSVDELAFPNQGIAIARVRAVAFNFILRTPFVFLPTHVEVVGVVVELGMLRGAEVAAKGAEAGEEQKQEQYKSHENTGNSARDGEQHE